MRRILKVPTPLLSHVIQIPQVSTTNGLDCAFSIVLLAGHSLAKLVGVV